MAIHTHSLITIDEKGTWYNTEEQSNAIIEQPDILKYFKQNLFFRDDEYIIDNHFGEKLEHAHLKKVEGFPLFVSRIIIEKEISFLLDSGETISARECELYRSEDIIWLLLKSRNLPARFSPAAMTGLLDYLEEDTDHTYFLRFNNQTQRLKERNPADFFYS